MPLCSMPPICNFCEGGLLLVLLIFATLEYSKTSGVHIRGFYGQYQSVSDHDSDREIPRFIFTDKEYGGF